MLRNRIEELREKLNKELETKLPNDEYVLKLSQELDKLIVRYYKYEVNKDNFSEGADVDIFK
ncbi:aspartyl-phosphate phosphatase Spo0E family protein [Tissierella creatinini]|nr:aspartyl-phosphate phosphatase Spo0E family protein [Tissierella creatinini]TJX63563.1 aspartyl-phosphate phosphatase Spo0E family protein [Soehngenia saccharolytica]